MQEAALPTLAMQIGAYGMGIRQMREGNGSAGGVLAPYNTYPARDGWITLMAGPPARFWGLGEFVGKAEVADNSRHIKLAGRSKNHGGLERLSARWSVNVTPPGLMNL